MFSNDFLTAGFDSDFELVGTDGRGDSDDVITSPLAPPIFT